VTIAAVVVSLPERHGLLCEALASVHAQSLPVDDIVIGVDPYRLGEVANMNRLLAATDCDWVAFLHDDDLWEPDHLATAAKHFDTADVIVARFEMVGRPWSTIEPWHDNFDDLRWTNWIGSPSMVVARREVWGEWCNPYGKYRWVDWANYNRLLDKGARFADTHSITAVYRFTEHGNGSWRR
jgi:glycosyltransferase involved in cell wall biosynthesis